MISFQKIYGLFGLKHHSGESGDAGRPTNERTMNIEQEKIGLLSLCCWKAEFRNIELLLPYPLSSTHPPPPLPPYPLLQNVAFLLPGKGRISSSRCQTIEHSGVHLFCSCRHILAFLGKISFPSNADVTSKGRRCAPT